MGGHMVERTKRIQTSLIVYEMHHSNAKIMLCMFAGQ
jgi:hypothetical protein